MTALITCCNEALALLAAGSVASLTENSIEAREANRFTPPLLAELADWAEWSFLRKREVLAEISNDRPAEWLHAYAAPADLGGPIAIRAVEDAAADLPTSGPFTLPVQDVSPILFIVEGGVVYTNVAAATLVYSRGTIEAEELPALARRAFVLELAARMALPLKKDGNVAKLLAQQAAFAKAEAISAEENKNPRREVRYISEAEYARAGVGV